jgi:hypothetical protein
MEEIHVWPHVWAVDLGIEIVRFTISGGNVTNLRDDTVSESSRT